MGGLGDARVALPCLPQNGRLREVLMSGLLALRQVILMTLTKGGEGLVFEHPPRHGPRSACTHPCWDHKAFYPSQDTAVQMPVGQWASRSLRAILHDNYVWGCLAGAGLM